MSRSIKLNKKKVILVSFSLVIIISLIITFSILMKYKNYQDKVDSMIFSDIDLSTIADGVYVGESDTGVIYAKTEVTVKNGKLLSINLIEHRHERGEAAEIIVDHMIQEQRTDVDAITSATNSSKVIRKAVENALTGK